LTGPAGKLAVDGESRHQRGGFCMSTLKNYLKYYWLENYLEDKVRSCFVKEKHLTAEQFFYIVEWKNQKFGKTKIKLVDKEIEKLTGDIYKVSSSEERLQILLKNGEEHTKGIQLATASAILTILYPKEFTVYDIRVRKQLCKYGLWEKVPRKKEPGKWDPLNITYHGNVVEEYFNDYLPVIEKIAKENNLSLRDCDRALWAKDWLEDLQDFIGSVNNFGMRKGSQYLKQI
jgi:hypothetical protein